MARNTKRSAEAAVADIPAPTAVEEAQTAAQSLATLGGGGGGDDNAPKKKARTTRGGAAAAVAAEETAATETETTAEAAAAATEAAAPTAAAKATRRSTRGGAPAAAAKEEPEAEAAKEDEIMEVAEPETTNAPAPTAIPPTTPSRVAGANVLASLGGSGEAKPELLNLESIPTLPDPVAVVVEVATAGGAAQHDYLLQNLVHVSAYSISWHHNNISALLIALAIILNLLACLLHSLIVFHHHSYIYRQLKSPRLFPYPPPKTARKNPSVCSVVPSLNSTRMPHPIAITMAPLLKSVKLPSIWVSSVVEYMM